MSKIAIINDTHFGVSNGAEIYLDYMEDFFVNQFFPYLKENKIKTIIHAGDFFDHRKYVNFKALKRVQDFFLRNLIKYNVYMHIIPGNHDVYWKQTNELNSIELALGDHPNVIIHMNPVDYKFGMHGDFYEDIALVPWITKDNYDECIDFIKNKSNAKCMIGHFEIAGFKMMQNAPVVSHGGMSTKEFDRFDMVLSGHYHTKSKQDNIRYLGTQYELTWADCDDTKHFHILDTNTGDLEAIHNPRILYYRYVYDDSKYDTPEDILNEDMSMFAGKNVRIVVSNKSDHFVFDKFIMKLEMQGPHDYRIFESFEEFEGSRIEDESISIENTETLIDSYIDLLADDESVDKNILKKKFRALYAEAQQHGTI